jgi:ATP-dependent RNA helicase DDX27
MAAEDFVMTIDSDPEDAAPLRKAGKSKAADAEDAVLNPEFSFDLAGDAFEDALAQDELSNVGANGKPVSVLHVST